MLPPCLLTKIWICMICLCFDMVVGNYKLYLSHLIKIHIPCPEGANCIEWGSTTVDLSGMLQRGMPLKAYVGTDGMSDVEGLMRQNSRFLTGRWDHAAAHLYCLVGAPISRLGEAGDGVRSQERLYEASFVYFLLLLSLQRARAPRARCEPQAEAGECRLCLKELRVCGDIYEGQPGYTLAHVTIRQRPPHIVSYRVTSCPHLYNHTISHHVTPMPIYINASCWTHLASCAGCCRSPLSDQASSRRRRQSTCLAEPKRDIVEIPRSAMGS